MRRPIYLPCLMFFFWGFGRALMRMSITSSKLNGWSEIGFAFGINHLVLAGCCLLGKQSKETGCWYHRPRPELFKVPQYRNFLSDVNGSAQFVGGNVPLNVILRSISAFITTESRTVCNGQVTVSVSFRRIMGITLLKLINELFSKTISPAKFALLASQVNRTSLISTRLEFVIANGVEAREETLLTGSKAETVNAGPNSR